MSAVVELSKSSVFELLTAGIEAYAVKHDYQRTVAIETIAHLWGSVNQRGPFKCHVDHVSVETSAVRRQDFVISSSPSLQIKKEVAEVFGAGFQYIGTAHTHPYLREDNVTAKVIRSEKLYQLSGSDHYCETLSPQIKVGNREYSVAIVLTIHAQLRADDRKDGLTFTANLKEFSFGNIKLWLFAQVFEHKAPGQLSASEIDAFGKFGLNFDRYKSSFSLPIPVETSLKTQVDMDTIFQAFGRLKISSDGAVFVSKAKAEKRWFGEV